VKALEKATSSDDPFSFSADKSLSCRDYSALLVGNPFRASPRTAIRRSFVYVVNTACFTSISEVTLNRKRVGNRKRRIEKSFSRNPESFHGEAASYELVIKVITTYNQKKKKENMGFTRTVGLVRFTSEMRQLSVATYLQAKRFIARASRASCRLRTRGERKIVREEMRCKISGTQNRRGRGGANPSYLGEYPLFCKDCGRVRREIRAPCVSAILFCSSFTEWSMALCVFHLACQGLFS